MAEKKMANLNHIIPDSDPSDDEQEAIPELPEKIQVETRSTLAGALPIDVIERAKKVTDNPFPDKSAPKYEIAYKKFVDWMTAKGISEICQTVVLAYFHELSEKNKPSTCWCIYSMLRSQIHAKHNINIHDYAPLISFLKKNSKGFAAVKANVLEPEEIAQFIKEAPDNQYLAIKVALIFGIQGACRKCELCSVVTNDIVDKKDMIIVNIPKTKTDKARSFIVDGEFYNIYKKYADLRPTGVTTNRFFLNYRDGKCSKQVIGINSFAKMPQTVATYLNLENSKSYTSHSFRRTSATLLVDAGASRMELKRHGGWKSDTVAEGYVEDSMRNKKKICNMISQRVLSTITPSQIPPSDDTFSFPSTSYSHPKLFENKPQQKENSKFDSSNLDKGLNLSITNCSNITIVLGKPQK